MPAKRKNALDISDAWFQYLIKDPYSNEGPEAPESVAVNPKKLRSLLHDNEFFGLNV